MRPAAAVIGLLCALAVLAWSPGARRTGDSAPASKLSAAAADLLRPARGTVWWVDRGCRVGRLRLPAGRIVQGPSRHCHVWPAPTGALALASQDDPESPRPPGNLAVLSGRRLRTSAVIGVRSDAVSPGVSWSPDGSAVAFCVKRGDQEATVTVHVSSIHASSPIRHRCPPAWSGSTLVTSDGRHVYLGAVRVSIAHLLTRALGAGPPDIRIAAIAASLQGLAVVVEQRLPEGVEPGASWLVTIDQQGGLVHLGRLPPGSVEAIGVSQPGTWLWVQHAAGQARLLPLDRATRPPAAPAAARGYAFSPDGRFVVAALAGELRIIDLRSGRSTSLTDVDPMSVAWTR